MGSAAPPPARTGARTGPRTAFVIAAGDPPERSALAGIESAELVVAADAGVDHAIALGFRVDVVVGDLDSASVAALEAAEAGGARVERHPVDKDATDLELALHAARNAGVDAVVVVGGGGGRVDHFLANTLLLGTAALADVAVSARIGDTDVVVVRDHATLDGRPGDLCSLLPLGGTARGVETTGLRYPLTHEDLVPGTSRGVSNELVDAVAEVRLASGVLLAVLPDARRGSPDWTGIES